MGFGQGGDAGFLHHGVGRDKAAALENKPGERGPSMGLQITGQRLSLLNQNEDVKTFYLIEDILNENNSVAGTSVTLKIGHHQEHQSFA